MSENVDRQIELRDPVSRADPDDFLEYLGSIGGQLAHLAMLRRHTFIAYLLGMVVREVVLTLEARAVRRRAGAR